MLISLFIQFKVLIILICVGYAAPIAFHVDSLVDWLAESQLLVDDIVGYFSHNFMAPDRELGKLL